MGVRDFCQPIQILVTVVHRHGIVISARDAISGYLINIANRHSRSRHLCLVSQKPHR
jgi:hypothetical protein